MDCPGSVGLSKGVVDEESEYAAVGTAAHTLGETCLSNGRDAWTYIGQEVFEGTLYDAAWGEVDDILVDKEMADAVQVYLDAIRNQYPDHNQDNSYIEKGFHCPSLHKLFYGRSDFTYIDFPKRTLHVWDYKNGAGIIIDVVDNPQCKYYGIGILEELQLWDEIDTVVLHISQPNGHHADGPNRSWAISAADLELWLYETLLPAMDHALVSRDTASGEWCRFCPARSQACPQLIKDTDELEELVKMAEKRGVKELSNKQIGRMLDLMDVFKIAVNAATKTAYSRLQAGKKIPGRKLTKSRSNRAWKKGADKAIKAKFGKQAFTDPKLKSPTQIEAMPQGEAISERWAFKPDNGLTLSKSTDGRAEVSKDTKSMFVDQTKKGKKK